MLRQVLDAANGQRQQAADPLEHSINKLESDSLLQVRQGQQNYSATQNTNFNDNVSQSRSFPSDVEDYGSMNGWDEHDDAVSDVSEATFLERTWKAIRGWIDIVFDVNENLWDSPDNVRLQDAKRNRAIVFFWFFVLATGYSLERTTFKLLVDRSGPFRLLSVQMVALTHAVLIGIGMILSAMSRNDFSFKALGIPIVDVGLMALLDTVHMLLVFLFGLHVSPTLTVILVQFTLPLTCLITQFVHPDGCTKTCFTRKVNDTDEEQSVLRGWGGLAVEHLLGSVIITVAVLLALTPSIYTIWDPSFFLYADTIPIQTAYNTLLFVSSCIPAAASQLYKEHVFLQHKQPVEADRLNFILSIFQVIFASIISPLVYTLQGLAATDDWPTLYPSSSFSRNYLEGLQCFMGTLDEERASSGYVDEAFCQYSITLVLFHSFAIISVGIAVDKIINAGATKVMYRGVSAGIIFSAILLYIYDMNTPDYNYGAGVDSLNLICVVLLVLGAEVYHRSQLQEATFETVYQTIDNYFDQD